MADNSILTQEEIEAREKDILKYISRNGSRTIEIDEAFQVMPDNEKYKMSKTGMKKEVSEDMWQPATNSNILERLLLGEATAFPVTWKPGNGDRYYVPGFTGEAAYPMIWEGSKTDTLNFESGMVCRSEGEAIRLRRYILDYVEKEVRKNGLVW